MKLLFGGNCILLNRGTGKSACYHEAPWDTDISVCMVDGHHGTEYYFHGYCMMLIVRGSSTATP